ncbi:hypothetical protein F5Y07DRAFT_79363 [Xylaria sp. FL0933]|nr:hypothetical protein F5Y07DRAFT_79363 [Xylaria sp. FL0933]
MIWPSYLVLLVPLPPIRSPQARSDHVEPSRDRCLFISRRKLPPAAVPGYADWFLACLDSARVVDQLGTQSLLHKSIRRCISSSSLYLPFCNGQNLR